MDQTEKLSITVTAQQAETIRQQVASGAYASASEVIRAGLRALEREREEYQKRIESIRARIQESLDDPRPSLPAEEVFKRLRATIMAQAEELDGQGGDTAERRRRPG